MKLIEWDWKFYLGLFSLSSAHVGEVNSTVPEMFVTKLVQSSDVMMVFVFPIAQFVTGVLTAQMALMK